MNSRAFIIAAILFLPSACGFIDSSPVACGSSETEKLLRQAVSDQIRAAFTEQNLEVPEVEAVAVAVDLKEMHRARNPDWRGSEECQAQVVATYPGAIEGLSLNYPTLKAAVDSAGFKESGNKISGEIRYISSLTGHQRSHVVDLRDIKVLVDIAAMQWRTAHLVPAADANESVATDMAPVPDVPEAQADAVGEVAAFQPETPPIVEPARRGPSFDCAKAATNVEVLICGDIELSNLDADLAQAYKSALSSSQDRSALKRAQVEWLKGRVGRCEDAECVRAAYVDRMAELSNQKGHGL